jgi:aryl-alcohol dehydrogenase-like predicted oxidoreductase
MDRRRFTQSLAGAAAGLWAGLPSRGVPAQAVLPTRRLGRDGPAVTMLGLGGHHVALAGSDRAARTLVDAALAEGIRFFDTAESYGNGRSERWLGAALASARASVFLMSKTFALRERSAESARRHLAGSLERLRTDYLDLWQLHSVRSVADVDRAFAPGGAMEFILEAKRRGTVRLVGVTGHARPDAQLRALHHWDRGMRFDVMQLPINPIDWHQQSFARQVLPELERRGIGVIAMKTSADGRLLSAGICTVAECLRYAWSLPVSVAVVGMESAAQVRENAGSARAFTPYSTAELAALRERIRPRAQLDLEWYKA